MEPDVEAQRDQETRRLLLEQLDYLTHEAEALHQAAQHVPTDLLSSRAPGTERSIKEEIGLLARWDEAVYPGWIERMVAEETPRFEEPDEDALLEDTAWNDTPLEDLLDRLQGAREKLIDTLRQLPPEAWGRTAHFEGEAKRDVYLLTRDIARQDHARLRRMTRLLYESNLSGEEQGVPG